MKKTILNLKDVQSLNKTEQKTINGGNFGPVSKVCNSPMLNDKPRCPSGYHPHPTHGACICCKS